MKRATLSTFGSGSRLSTIILIQLADETENKPNEFERYLSRKISKIRKSSGSVSDMISSTFVGAVVRIQLG